MQTCTTQLLSGFFNGILRIHSWNDLSTFDKPHVMFQDNVMNGKQRTIFILTLVAQSLDFNIIENVWIIKRRVNEIINKSDLAREVIEISASLPLHYINRI